MTQKVSMIEINLGEAKPHSEIADALRVIADQIDQGSYCGIAGWSDVSYNLILEEKE